MKSIILAGGTGTRLWPLSRGQYPKQFIKIKDTSLFQDSFQRCIEVSNVDEIFVVTNNSQKFFVTGQIEELGYNIPENNVLIEPEGKNTLPAICFGMREIEKRYNGNKIVGIFPSDHILDKKAMKMIDESKEIAKDYLITFGIVSASAHTGYGYIKTGEKIGIGYKVTEFKEKPSLEDAEKFIKEGCLWNSGMFLFGIDLFFSELRKYFPSIYETFQSSKDINTIYKDLPSISIDYGLLEKSSITAVVKLETKWSDLGNFDAVYNELEKNGSGNAVYGCDHVLVDSANNLVYSKSSKKLVSLIDVNDMAIVDTPDALLVCPRTSHQKVKEVVAALKNDGRLYFHTTVYRPWGSYTVLESTERHKIKNITVMPGKKLSLQLHHHRSEHWIVVKGMALVRVGKTESYLRPGESTFIKSGTMHRISNPGMLPLEIFEVQLGDAVEEDDIVRLDDDYGRK